MSINTSGSAIQSIENRQFMTINKKDNSIKKGKYAMFKKNEIKKALDTICKSEEISAAILKAKTEDEQSDGAFVKNFASDLYSDELMEYLNDNSFDDLLVMRFGMGVDLGELSDCASAVYQEQFLNNKEYRGRREKICLVGEDEIVDYDCPPDSEVEGDTKTYRCVIKGSTYITENGDVLCVRETVYSTDGIPLLTIRTLDPSIAPSLSKISKFCSEDTLNKIILDRHEERNYITYYDRKFPRKIK